MTYLERYKAEHSEEKVSDDFIKDKYPCEFYTEIFQVCLFEEDGLGCSSCWNREVLEGED